MSKHWSDRLVQMNACAEAVQYARAHKDFRSAWEQCKHVDWLLWYLGKTLPDTQESIESLTCIAIKIVQAIPGRAPIPTWEFWADNYLSNIDRTRKKAAEAARAVAVAWAAWAAQAAARAAWAAQTAEAALAVARAAARAAQAAAQAAQTAAWAAQTAQTARAADIVRLSYPRPPKATKHV